MTSPAAPLTLHPDRLLPADPQVLVDDRPFADPSSLLLQVSSTTPFLAGVVGGHRLAEDEAVEAAVILVSEKPRKVFNL